MRVLDGHERMGWSVAYSPDARYLLAGGQDGVRAWDLTSGGLPILWPGLERSISRVAFLPSGKAVVLCSTFGTSRYAPFQAGRCSNATNQAEPGRSRGERRQGWSEKTGPATSITSATTPACGWPSAPIASACPDPTPCSPGTLARHLRRQGLGHARRLPAGSRSLAPGGTRIASGSIDRTVLVGDLQTGKRCLTWEAGGRVNLLHFLDDNTLLAGVGFSVVLFDVKYRQPCWKFTAHRRPVVALAVLR